jgi:hypothetical protein
VVQIQTQRAMLEHRSKPRIRSSESSPRAGR